MSANVVIPKELFPKEETFFYGELLTTKPKKIYPSELLKVTKDISILEFLTKDESLGSEVKADCLQKLKSLEDERSKIPVENENLNEVFQKPFICTLLKNGLVLFKFEIGSLSKEKTVTNAEIVLLGQKYSFVRDYKDKLGRSF
ncbi:MAG: hypothetical protein IPG22_23375 [Acidobacteria bacterium]|nr:hypothetical protein [Acidobacteriota bacterium]